MPLLALLNLPLLPPILLLFISSRLLFLYDALVAFGSFAASQDPGLAQNLVLESGHGSPGGDLFIRVFDDVDSLELELSEASEETNCAFCFDDCASVYALAVNLEIELIKVGLDGDVCDTRVGGFGGRAFCRIVSREFDVYAGATAVVDGEDSEGAMRAIDCDDWSDEVDKLNRVVEVEEQVLACRFRRR